MAGRDAVDDLVVVVPGILGSRLADADGREVWGLSGPALLRGIGSFGRSVKGLRLPADIGDDDPGDGVRAVGLMRDVHGLPGVWSGVDGYTDLLDWLEQHFTLHRRVGSGEDASAPANLVPFAYDWRLSCRRNAALLAITVAEELERWRASAPQRADARVVFVCHSMGGLIARWYVERGGGAETTRRVITLGTPFRGSLDALLHLVNGLRPGFGPLGVDLTAFARSLPSLHQLTPEYACLAGLGDSADGLRKVVEVTGLPGVDAKSVADAVDFRQELASSEAGRRYEVEYLPVSGVLQPTPTTAVWAERPGRRGGWRLEELLTIDGVDEGGDGRVPRLSSAHLPGLKRPASTPWKQHGSLQNSDAVRWDLWGWLAPDPPTHRGPDDGAVPLGVRAPGLLLAGEPCEAEVTVPATSPDHDQLALTVRVDGERTPRPVRNLGGGRYRTVLRDLEPGPHRLEFAARHTPGSTVTALVLVAEGEPGADTGAGE